MQHLHDTQHKLQKYLHNTKLITKTNKKLYTCSTAEQKPYVNLHYILYTEAGNVFPKRYVQKKSNDMH